MKTIKIILLLGLLFGVQSMLGQNTKSQADLLQIFFDSSKISNNKAMLMEYDSLHKIYGEKAILHTTFYKEFGYINEPIYKVLWDTACWDAVEFVSKTRKLKVPINVTDRVNDFAKIFTDYEAKELRSVILNLNHTTKNEIVLITVPSAWVPKEGFNAFVKTLHKFWSQNSAIMKQGILVGINQNHKDVSIIAGPETSNHTTYSKIKSIKEKIILPKFKTNQFYEGTIKGLKEINNILP